MTDIEWTDATWNPVRGCSMAPGSELGGCLNCYAARLAAHNRPSMRSPTTGKPFAIFTDNGPRWTGKVELIESKLLEPLHWRKPRRVFVNSMSDLFHENLPYPDILHIFQVMAKCPRHTFQILTKRPAKMRELLSLCWWRNLGHSPEMGGNVWAKVIAGEQRVGDSNFLPNVWLGVSVENQPTADQRILELLRTPAALRFVSYEPALDAVDFGPLVVRICSRCGGSHRGKPNENPCSWCDEHGHKAATVGIDWGIIGGESGPGARPFRLDWARNTIRQFEAAGVPLFVKQAGANVIEKYEDGGGCVHKFKHPKGGDPAEWPEWMRVRQFPNMVTA